jgi:twitching motility protein PilU
VRATMLGDLASTLQAIVSQRLLRTVRGDRVPAVEIMLNTRLVSELIERADFSGVREAMEKSIAEGSQTFEVDIARLITEGLIDRKEGLAHADSSTNLLWRLQNDFTRGSSAADDALDTDDQPSFTEITLDVRN